MKISPELGEKWVYYWEEYSQNSSPEVLNLTRTVAVKYYYSIQTSLVLKRCSPSTGTQKFRTSQPESKTPLGLFHTLHLPKGLPRVPFESGQAAVPRRKDFQIAFVSGSSLACFPKEALTGEHAGAPVLSCPSAEVCGFIYVAFVLCMKKHSSGIGFSYVRFLFLFSSSVFFF